MYDLSLSAEQIEFRDTIRGFVDREIKPVALHPDRLQRLRPPFPEDLLALTTQLGLRTLALSEDFGGASADTLTACVVMEELAVGDVDVATAVAETVLLARVILEGGMNAAQRARFLPQFVDDETFHLAYARIAGDDSAWLYHRRHELQSAARVNAVRDGDRWILNGEAGFVSNANIARMIIVDIDSGNGAKLLMVPCGTQGISIRKPASNATATVKWYHGDGGYVAFTNCHVPGDHMLDVPHDLKRKLRQGVALQASINLGVGRAAFEAAVAYAKLRVQGGRPIIQHQAIGTKLANIAIQIEAARNLIWKAAWTLDHPDTETGDKAASFPLETAARIFTAEAVRVATEDAAECFGAMGVMLDMPLQKYVHDAVIFLHSRASTTVSTFEVAEAVAGFELSAA
jgi:butyryl-CoA dehydrogenase